jgi:UDP-N-acetylmuramate dehydrogenase
LKISENIPLGPFTTFGIGGPARWFAEAASEDEVAEACEWARQRGVPLFVLGGGSNVLISDRGFAGLVLRVGIKGIEQDGALFRVGAGENWDHCVEQTLGANCAGMECLAGIPGTVGGTPVQNVGAYGQEVANVIDRVRAFDVGSQEFVEFRGAECGFGYRRSRFNSTDRGRFIVTRVDYRLRAGDAPQLSYVDLKMRFADKPEPPSLNKVAEAVREIRRSKGMLLVEGDPDCHSAGSFFKNPAVEPGVAERVKGEAESVGRSLRMFPAVDGRVKIPAAWLIEQAGFAKGYGRAAAGISSRHTLALINRGGATAEEILALAREIAETVETKFGIRLEMEPEMIGF